MNRDSRDPSGHRGRHRLLLIFAPSPEDERVARQLNLLEGQEAALEDRDLLTLTFFEDGSEDSVRARRMFDVDAGLFVLVLVGKDGGEKFRSDEPVQPERLFDLIDAMPMRQREARARDPR